MPYNLKDEEEIARILGEIESSRKSEIMSGGGSRKIAPIKKAAPLDAIFEGFKPGQGGFSYDQLLDAAQKRIDKKPPDQDINSSAGGATANPRKEFPSPSDILPDDYRKGSHKDYPGLFSAANKAIPVTQDAGLTPNVVVPTKTEMYPEYPLSNRVEVPSGRGPVVPGLPQVPRFDVPEFSYPEFSDVSDKPKKSNTAAMRLLAHLNMAGNDYIKGASGFNPSNALAESILEDASKRDRAAQDRKDKLSDYFNKKQAALNDWQKLKNDAKKSEYDARLKRYVAGSKYGQTGEQENPFSRGFGKDAGRDFNAWLRGGMERGQSGKLDRVKNLFGQYIESAQKNNPSFRDLLVSGWGQAGKQWFNLNQGELAGIRHQLMNIYVDELRPTFGGQLSDDEREAFFNLLIDYSIDPKANAAALKARMDGMKRKIKSEGRKNRELSKIYLPRLDLNKLEDTSDSLELLE